MVPPPPQSENSFVLPPERRKLIKASFHYSVTYCIGYSNSSHKRHVWHVFYMCFTSFDGHTWAIAFYDNRLYDITHHPQPTPCTDTHTHPCGFADMYLLMNEPCLIVQSFLRKPDTPIIPLSIMARPIDPVFRLIKPGDCFLWEWFRSRENGNAAHTKNVVMVLFKQHINFA